MAGCAIINSIHDWGQPSGSGQLGQQWRESLSALQGGEGGPAKREGEVGGATNRFVDPPHPALSPCRRRERVNTRVTRRNGDRAWLGGAGFARVGGSRRWWGRDPWNLAWFTDFH